jgi:thiol-disulfide isomerase/thioredoxin
MNRVTFAACGLLTVLALAAGSATAQFNNAPTLKIGDPAPAFQVQTWIRGQPVTRFEKGKVYVLDFWATWCGGCIVAFPHISGIAEKYQNRVAFISVDVGEGLVEEKKNADPVAKVTKFLHTPYGQPLKLNVAVDGNSNTMWDTWIKTIRRAGLPTTYVIDQEGRIAWFDVNLDNLGWVLDEVLAHQWDHAKAAAVMKQKDAIDDLWMKMVATKGAEQRKLQRTILTASENFEKQFPDRKDAVNLYKIMALLDLDKSKLPNQLEQMAADPLSWYLHLSDSAGLTMQQKDLSKPTYLAVVKVLQRCLRNEYPAANTCGPNSTTYERLAAAYRMADDPTSAVTSIEKAIALANEEKAPATQIQKLQATLGKYKAASVRGS